MDVFLPLAVALAAIPVIAFTPDAPWRLPLGLAAALWAPGHALVSAAYARSRDAPVGLERVAIGIVVSLALLPLVSVGASLAGAFSPVTLAMALTAVTAGGGAVAFTRATPRAHRGSLAYPLHARPPSPAVTAAVIAAAVLVTGTLFLLPGGPPPGVPHHLALLGPDGSAESVPRALGASERVTLTLEIAAGDAAAQGPLTARVVPLHEDTLAPVTLLDTDVTLPAARTDARTLDVGPLDPGAYRLEAVWDVPAGARSVHAWLDVTGRAPS